MRHGIKKKKFNRSRAERESLYRNLVQSLFLHERIITTEQKAKVIRPFAEKLITKAKKQDVNSRRTLGAYLYIPEVAHKVWDDLGKRFQDRNGGYTRILKLGARKSDGTKMAVLELVTKADKKVKKESIKKEKTVKDSKKSSDKEKESEKKNSTK